MQVVRLECKDGWGPWRTDEPLGKVSLWDVLHKTYLRHSTHNPKGMPLPMKDGIPRREDDDFCAYPSIQSMKKWVNKKELARAIRIFGVRVLLIDLKEAKVGGHQVLYKKDWISKQKDISYRFVKKLKNNKKWKQ